MLRGSLEVVEFVPRQATTDAIPLVSSTGSNDIWTRLRLEHRTLTNCLAALAATALHALFVVPALWTGGMPQQPPDRNPVGSSALQWIVLEDSATAAAPTRVSQTSPTLVAIGLGDVVPTPPAVFPAPDASEHKDAKDQSVGEMYGRYVGQIHARVDRAWRRPRTAIGAPIFQCQVQVDQDGAGQVGDITLLQCNGDTRWRLSLVHAIEAASPLPVPPTSATFVQHVLLTFRAAAYSPGASAELYEPSGAGEYEADQREAQSRDALQAIGDAARTHSGKTIELRIEGSKVEVEPNPK